jgi:hypothetical protein
MCCSAKTSETVILSNGSKPTVPFFYLLAGLLSFLPKDHFFLSTPRHRTTGMWRRSFHSVMSVTIYWVLLLAFSLWPQREPPKQKNPLEWGIVDKTLLLVWVFLFVGGIERMEEFLFSSGVAVPWINHGFAHIVIQ